MAKALVIGSGFAGISAATHLAQKGYEVKVLEKNEGPGGRCSVWSKMDSPLIWGLHGIGCPTCLSVISLSLVNVSVITTP